MPAGIDRPASSTDPSAPVWDPKSAHWWIGETTSAGWRPTAWWDGTRWVPLEATPSSSPTSSGPGAGERRSSSYVDSAGTSSSYHLLGRPAQPQGLVVYLDGDGMAGHDAMTDPARAGAGPLGGSGGLVDIAERRGLYVLSIRTPSADATFWRDLGRNTNYVTELVSKISAELGTTRVAWVGYSGGAQLLTKGVLAREPQACTLTAIAAGGGGPQSVPDPPAGGACPLLWATGTADVATAAPDGYDALRDAQAGAGAYAARGWPAMIWTPQDVDHTGIRTQLGSLLDFQLNQLPTQKSSDPAPTTQASPRTSAPSTTTTTTPDPTTTTAASRSFDGQPLRGTLRSKFWPGRDVGWIVATPQGPARGTILVLHGKTDSAQKAYDELDLAAQAKASGFALAAIEGESTYWTDSGDIDTGAMVIQEYLPLLAAQGLPVDRIGLTGYSMGGLGALHLAEELGPQRVFGVAPMSAAVWEGGKPGAEGQAQQRVRAKLASIPVRIASGTEDSLTEVNKTLAQLIPHAQTDWSPGTHDFVYWRPALAAQLTWLAQQQ